MRTITLWQPWATLIALGEKQYETRHWPTDHRGLLAIHAGANRSQLPLVYQEPFREVLVGHGYHMEAQLPLGAVICVTELVDVFPVEDLYSDLDEQERAFGNFSPGRYAWELRVVEVFAKPIPARGAQGLWEWKGS